MATRVIIGTLVGGMLLSGASNSLLTKYQDIQCVDPPACQHTFEQPVLQTAQMFIGETFCMLFLFVLGFWRAREGGNFISERMETDESDYDSAALDASPPMRSIHGWKRLALFWIPSTLDILGTTCMNVGLIFVPVSVYQMLRGALVLWVALLSIIFLKRKILPHQWASLAVVVAGVTVVGIASLKGADKTIPGIEGEEAPAEAIFGIVLIVGAQIFTACQFVLEEKIMSTYSIEPLAAVGFEGLTGTISTLLLMVILHLCIGRTPEGHGGYFDAVTGLEQMWDNRAVFYSSLAIACSIAVYNATGLGITRSLSATARSTIDTCRTVVIWSVSLLLGWESFKFLQVVGFVLLVYGTLIFNGLVTFPNWTTLHPLDPPISLPTAAQVEQGVPLLNEHTD